ncbi:MAG: cyclase family protein [Ruminococcaceae bacterium]|nr:cyclase family protein [Oscillospiraceae bacterium]
MKVIDLSHTIKENMPVYPGTEPPKLNTVNTCEKDCFKETRITMCSHIGTHIDAPAHVISDGLTLDEFPAEQFIGKALVIDCRHISSGENIMIADIERYGEKVLSAEFLLFNTGWDRKWKTREYFVNYPCIDEEVLDFIIKKKYKGIGFDTFGPDPVDHDQIKRHKKLFLAINMINIENLCNLEECGNEIFNLAALPIKTENSDGAPARVIAIID